MNTDLESSQPSNTTASSIRPWASAVIAAHRALELKCLNLTVELCRASRFPAWCVARATCEPSLPRAVLALVMSCMLSGCSRGAAPSFELFGAFFPAWMLCALIGILGAAGTRVVLTTPALNGGMPFQLGVCTALGVIVALFSWMLLFG